ncbi:MAG: hypothetical protein Ct9H90mP2_00470 [Dehalococcoidia bacterium]|nr:MAG: hypothetical protein Ct9H90mP2_00470 [Dehalococcoidia bacterium]
MKAVLLAIGIASVGFIGIMIWLFPDPVPGEYPSSHMYYHLGFQQSFSGTIFGVGMVFSWRMCFGKKYIELQKVMLLPS